MHGHFAGADVDSRAWCGVNLDAAWSRQVSQSAVDQHPPIHCFSRRQSQRRLQVTVQALHRAVFAELYHQLTTDHGNALMQLLQLDKAQAVFVGAITQDRQVGTGGQAKARSQRALREQRGDLTGRTHRLFHATREVARRTVTAQRGLIKAQRRKCATAIV